MTTGPETPRLSAKLSDRMQSMQQQQTDLMASASKSFESDIRTILNDALDTIEADIRTRQESLFQNLNQSLNEILNREWATAERALQIPQRQMKLQWLMIGLTIPLSVLLTWLALWIWTPSSLDSQPSNQASNWASINQNHPYVLIDTKTGSVMRCQMTENQSLCSPL